MSAPPAAVAPAEPLRTLGDRPTGTRPADRDEPLLAPLAARGIAFALLLAFASLHWMQLVRPAEAWRAWASLVIAALVVGGLVLAAPLPRAGRWAVCALVVVGGLALSLLAGGVADELLKPARWGELGSGIGRGLEALPGVNVPYRGVDPWTRTVMTAGGTVLALAATALAFWPRGRDAAGGPARVGFVLPSLILLVALFAVPAVVLSFGSQFLRGALLALLVLAYLRLERLRAGDGRAAALVGCAGAVVALVLAPVLDGAKPWWDYENWAQDAATQKSTSFTWNQDYQPLTWPRDGRELLRVTSRLPAYWKAENLDLFDGRVWRTGFVRRQQAPDAQIPAGPNRRKFTQSIRVSVRNMRSATYLTAGVGISVSAGNAFPLDGIFGAATPLKRGDAYTARVYTPRPTEDEMAAAGTTYDAWLGQYRQILVSDPDVDPVAGRGERPESVAFPAYGSVGAATLARRDSATGLVEQTTEGVQDALDGSGLGRIRALAERLQAGTTTPLEYLQRIEGYLSTGFTYSETPPPASRTLDGFLFDTKSGFCQQYSGSMALLLRMGGVPARVAAGFSSGSFDSDSREYVVRDLDAHAWVEAWFPGFGWVTFDPTPAVAPPRSQPGDEIVTGSGARGASIPPNLLFGDRQGTGGGGAAADVDADGGGLGSPAIAGIAGAGGALLLLGGALALRHRRRLPPPAERPMAELQRALERARIRRGPATTLTALERTLGRDPGAAGYLRALREQRYSGRDVRPTAAQRRGLRTALAGEAGRLRAWWALPPAPWRRD
jgi:transglutaminase-like putative cysteine protease